MGLYVLALLNYLINAKFEPQSFDYATKKDNKLEDTWLPVNKYNMCKCIKPIFDIFYDD